MLPGQRGHSVRDGKLPTYCERDPQRTSLFWLQGLMKERQGCSYFSKRAKTSAEAAARNIPSISCKLDAVIASAAVTILSQLGLRVMLSAGAPCPAQSHDYLWERQCSPRDFSSLQKQTVSTSYLSSPPQLWKKTYIKYIVLLPQAVKFLCMCDHSVMLHYELPSVHYASLNPMCKVAV